jgi:uncharacterized membrane protein
MSSSLPVIAIILSALILLGILAVIIIRTKMKDGTPLEIDYYVFFVVGISVLPLGIVLSIVVSPGFIGLAGVGLIDILIGLSHREKWSRKRME